MLTWTSDGKNEKPIFICDSNWNVLGNRRDWYRQTEFYRFCRFKQNRPEEPAETDDKIKANVIWMLKIEFVNDSIAEQIETLKRPPKTQREQKRASNWQMLENRELARKITTDSILQSLRC